MTFARDMAVDAPDAVGDARLGDVTALDVLAIHRHPTAGELLRSGERTVQFRFLLLPGSAPWRAEDAWLPSRRPAAGGPHFCGTGWAKT